MSTTSPTPSPAPAGPGPWTALPLFPLGTVLFPGWLAAA